VTNFAEKVMLGIKLLKPSLPMPIGYVSKRDNGEWEC